jgi:hypothetical protein
MPPVRMRHLFQFVKMTRAQSAARTGKFVIASAAKQSSAQCQPPLDCFVARAPRNDAFTPATPGRDEMSSAV